MMNLKELAKLAKICRKLGISHYKSADFEFSLDRDVPSKRVRKAKVNKTDLQQTLEAMSDEIPGDMPSDESLLFWSVGNPTDEAKVDS